MVETWLLSLHVVMAVKWYENIQYYINFCTFNSKITSGLKLNQVNVFGT